MREKELTAQELEGRIIIERLKDFVPKNHQRGNVIESLYYMGETIDGSPSFIKRVKGDKIFLQLIMDLENPSRGTAKAIFGRFDNSKYGSTGIIHYNSLNEFIGNLI